MKKTETKNSNDLNKDITVFIILWAVVVTILTVLFT